MKLRSLRAPRAASAMTAPDDARAVATPARLRVPASGRRPALYLSVATAGALAIALVPSAEQPATAEAVAPVSVAEQLGITAEQPAVGEGLEPLTLLAASRGERDAARVQAVQAQNAADQAELGRQAAEQAAAEEAARAAERAAAEAAAAAAAPGRGTNAAVAPAGSYQDYAVGRVGGSGQFSCLESLWGKESGWNPNAQNPTSTAYGIPQFLDSTWAGTGVAKTSDGYRQIDAGLIYIENRYGTPCGAWAHSQAHNWY